MKTNPQAPVFKVHDPLSDSSDWRVPTSKEVEIHCEPNCGPVRTLRLQFPLSYIEAPLRVSPTCLVQEPLYLSKLAFIFFIGV